jgi:hypothetical protein
MARVWTGKLRNCGLIPGRGYICLQWKHINTAILVLHTLNNLISKQTTNRTNCMVKKMNLKLYN